MKNSRCGSMFIMKNKYNNIILVFISRMGWTIKLSKEGKIEKFNVVFFDISKNKIYYSVNKKDTFLLLEENDGLFMNEISPIEKEKALEFFDFCQNISYVSFFE